MSTRSVTRSVCHLGDIRQGDNGLSRQVNLVVKNPPADGQIAARWTATTRDQEGILDGGLEIPATGEATYHKLPFE
jgi:hypothetical protein